MKKVLISLLAVVMSVCVFAQGNLPANAANMAQWKATFKARHKQIKKIVKKYKKATPEEQVVLKAELEKLVSQQVDDGFAYMEKRLAQERAVLDNLEQQMKKDQANLPAFKAQRVEDLLTGEAKRKHKEARKRWKKQVEQTNKRFR